MKFVTKSPYNNPRWLRLRKLVLNAHPLCKHCLAEGEQKLATEVDHIKRAVYDGKKVDQKRFWSIGNLQPLCKSHHLSKRSVDYEDKAREKLGIRTFSI